MEKEPLTKKMIIQLFLSHVNFDFFFIFVCISKLSATTAQVV